MDAMQNERFNAEAPLLGLARIDYGLNGYRFVSSEYDLECGF